MPLEIVPKNKNGKKSKGLQPKGPAQRSKGLKTAPEGKEGKGLRSLPTPVRNKMGYMKKGGKIIKMRGGGMASRGLNFRVM